MCMLLSPGVLWWVRRRAARSAFTREHQNWQVCRRSPVLFTDESMFTLSTCDRCHSVSRLSHICHTSSGCTCYRLLGRCPATAPSSFSWCLLHFPPDAADLCVISTPAKSKLEKNQSGTVRREQRAAKTFPLPGVSYVTSLLHLSLLFAPKQLKCNRGLRSIIVQTDIPDV